MSKPKRFATAFWCARDVVRLAAALGLTLSETDAIVLLLENETEIEEAMEAAAVVVITERLRTSWGEPP